MQTTLLTDLTVKEICEGFVYNQLEGKGLFGWSGKLTIQPEYQRNYLYAENEGKKEMAVTVMELAELPSAHALNTLGELPGIIRIRTFAK